LAISRKYPKSNQNQPGEVFWIIKNPSFFDHFKRRSDNTKNTFGNIKDLTLDLDGQFDSARDYQNGFLKTYPSYQYILNKP
jgi:hypothetical protein